MEYINMVLDAIKGNWVPLVLLIAPFIMPNEWLRKTGFGLGKVLSIFFRRKLNKDGEKVESYIQGTVAAFIEGLNSGLDADDNTPMEDK